VCCDFHGGRRGNVAGSSVLVTIKHDTVISGAKLPPNVGLFDSWLIVPHFA
jgi:hypothetical protein